MAELVCGFVAFQHSCCTGISTLEQVQHTMGSNDMESKTIVLITGANQGCGYECAKNMVLSSASYHILLGSRDIEKGKQAADEINAIQNALGSAEPIQLEVTSDESIDAAAAQVTAKYGRLDILVNNAGINPKNKLRRDALRNVLAVNVIGPVAVTEAFLPLLRASRQPRIVMVSSSVGSLSQAADPDSPYYKQKSPDYRSSKSALNMIMLQYHKELAAEGFKVLGADPGLVATNFVDAKLVRERGGLSPEAGGGTIAEAAKGDRDADVGRVCGRYGISPW